MVTKLIDIVSVVYATSIQKNPLCVLKPQIGHPESRLHLLPYLGPDGDFEHVCLGRPKRCPRDYWNLVLLTVPLSSSGGGEG